MGLSASEADFPTHFLCPDAPQPHLQEYQCLPPTPIVFGDSTAQASLLLG